MSPTLAHVIGSFVPGDACISRLTSSSAATSVALVQLEAQALTLSVTLAVHQLIFFVQLFHKSPQTFLIVL